MKSWKQEISLEEAHKLAREVREHAYAPYSKFLVGSTIITSGGIYTGCNVENASFGATICAERGAIMQAFATEGGKIEIEAVIVCTLPAVPPCALCLQVLAEFSAPDTPVYMSTPDKISPPKTMGELLPIQFTEVPN